ncbi:50S ribosomal protein L22 [Candidatus Saccharibacteria bacterium]|nr:ribosomal protein L22 [uncultured bacterium]PID30599.1 MAG: 50S ribosomal protein L22 [Candidatus Saccharibacteria bacterium]PID99320.1 MAG: 50S ribosomal protein L22 [Candidatus Saccharibacteria bacterium]
MAVKAESKAVRMSPRKLAAVAALVRGRSVADAVVILEHTPRRAATPVLKTIKSAQANASHNHNYKADTLVISEITVNHGPRMKRYRPAAMGRALPYMKRSSHIRVLVDGELRPAKKPAAKEPKK